MIRVIVVLAFAFAVAFGLIFMPSIHQEYIDVDVDAQIEVGAGRSSSQFRIIPGEYIVTLKPEFVGEPQAGGDTNLSNATLEVQNQTITAKAEDVNATLKRHGNGEVDEVYDRAINGFSVKNVRNPFALVADPAVELVEQNTLLSLDAQYTSTAVDRIDLDKATTAAFRPDKRETKTNVDIAVIDTVVQPGHPDLNIFQSVRFVDAADAEPEYHGTHVAGLCCARDNLGGIVGTAQGARIWNLQVCGGTSGFCAGADIIEAADYVVTNAGSIEVATMSIGGGNPRASALTTAIASVVSAGVTFFQSAGNEASVCQDGWGCDTQTTAIVVSALQDFDGKCGGLKNGVSGSGATLRDDAIATYSNWGPEVDIMTPGSLLISTFPAELSTTGTSEAYPYIGISPLGSYGSISGTSMATPVAAGVGALVKVANPGFTPAQVLSSLQTNAYSQTLSCDGSSKGGLVTGANSKDSSKLLFAGNY